jgi:hypothetical protein
MQPLINLSLGLAARVFNPVNERATESEYRYLSLFVKPHFERAVIADRDTTDRHFGNNMGAQGINH